MYIIQHPMAPMALLTYDWCFHLSFCNFQSVKVARPFLMHFNKWIVNPDWKANGNFHYFFMITSVSGTKVRPTNSTYLHRYLYTNKRKMNWDIIHYSQIFPHQKWPPPFEEIQMKWDLFLKVPPQNKCLLYKINLYIQNT